MHLQQINIQNKQSQSQYLFKKMPNKIGASVHGENLELYKHDYLVC